MKKRYLYPIANFTLLYFLGSALYYLASLFISKMLYPTLNDLLPSIFPIPNYVLESEKYEIFDKVMTCLSLFLCFYITNRLSLFFDNSRFEYIVKKTEGMYRMKEGLKLYYSAFSLSDLTVSLLVPVTLTLPLYIYVPREFLEKIFLLFFNPAFISYGLFGCTAGAIVLTLAVLLSRLLAGISATKSYRARWLSADLA